jgi:hypothetical protein
MSTHSFVGTIEKGKVTFGYHHSDSYLESLGIDLFNGIKTKEDVEQKLSKYAEMNNPYTEDSDKFFEITNGSSFEFCYAFDLESETWYVSSCHFKDNGKKHKLTEVVKDDDVMMAYIDMYFEDSQKRILNIIRENIKAA